MKKVVVALGAAFILSTTPVFAATNTDEPKDSFIMFGWRVYSQAPTVVQLDSKPKPVAHTPVKKPSVSKPTIKAVITSTAPTSSWNVSKASQYGGSDGFYYHHFACGGIYYPSVVGVAHKSLPCGTKVTFKYYGTKKINGRSVKGWYTATLRVIDRGPYCCGRSWDFTTEGAKAIGFYGIGTVFWKLAER